MATKQKPATKSDSPVAARAALDEQQTTSGPDREKQAKQQEAEQRRELREGKADQEGRKRLKDREGVYDKGDGDRASLRVAVGRANKGGAQGGVVDNMSARHDGDALEGHFVTIDLGNKQAHAAVQDAITGRSEDKVEPTPNQGGYGIYLNAAETDPDTGYPVTANVRLRDDSNALVTVPYEALSPAVAGRR